VDALLVAGYGVRALDLFGRRSDVPAIVLDMLRAAACLRWTPRVELTEGVARTWQWILGLGELDS